MPNIRRHLAIAALVALTAPLGRSVAAQAPNSGTVLHISPYAGYMVFGSYLKGPFGTSVTSAPGLLYGAQAGLSLSPNLSLVGNAGYTASSIQVGVPILGGLSIGNSSMLMYDAGLEYNFSASRESTLPFSPFVQAGVGAMKYDISASVVTTHATNFAGNIGAGADFALGHGLALRLLAKDYIGKFNFQDATGLGINGSTANNIALTAGLRFDF
jgi:hypothetical protein